MCCTILHDRNKGHTAKEGLTVTGDRVSLTFAPPTADGTELTVKLRNTNYIQKITQRMTD